MDDSTPLTSRDLARLAGVSQSTVSRVMTGSTKVSEQTRARVLAVLEEMDYTPNAVARAMKIGRTDSVGVFMSRITSPFHAALLDAIGRRLANDGLQMILWNLEHDPHELAMQVIRQRLVDGFLFTSATFDSRSDKLAVASGVPTVLLHRGISGLDCDQVVGDNYRGAWNVGNYLLAAGHTRIGLISSPIKVSTAAEREYGFLTALRKGGHPCPERYIVRDAFTHATGHAAIRDLLALPEPPTAVFAITDLLAHGVIDGARSVGVRLPEDLWVCGFDNVEMSSWEAYDLTTVNQPVDEIVDLGVRLLQRRIADRMARRRIVRRPCDLVVRGSTAGTPAPEPVDPPRRPTRLDATSRS